MPVEIKIIGENAKEALVELSNLAGGLTHNRESGGDMFRHPADEPASALLARLRAGRANAPATSDRRRNTILR